METRKDRALTQNLALISIEGEIYNVRGSTGNVYQIVIKNGPVCSCPDYTKRQIRCKHIYFVLITVLKVENTELDSYDQKTPVFANRGRLDEDA